MRRSSHFGLKAAVFAGDSKNAHVLNSRAAGRSVCTMESGRIVLFHNNVVSDLGAIAEMPLTCGGAAVYNTANIMAASLAAAALRIAPEVIAATLATFGATRFDNPGRLEPWTIGGVHVLLDYAHNPAGLAGLFKVARARQAGSGGRIGLLLGQAGNREDEDVKALAIMAAQCAPDRIILKDIDGMLRGRTPGEVPRLLHATLLGAGFDHERVETVLPELDAAKRLFAWASAGDVVVMPVHGVAPRVAIRQWLDGGAVG